MSLSVFRSDPPSLIFWFLSYSPKVGMLVSWSLEPRLETNHHRGIQTLEYQMPQYTLSEHVDTVISSSIRIPFFNKVYHQQHPTTARSAAGARPAAAPGQQQLMLAHYYYSVQATLSSNAAAQVKPNIFGKSGEAANLQQSERRSSYNGVFTNSSSYYAVVLSHQNIPASQTERTRQKDFLYTSETGGTTLQFTFRSYCQWYQYNDEDACGA